MSRRAHGLNSLTANDNAFDTSVDTFEKDDTSASSTAASATAGQQQDVVMTSPRATTPCRPCGARRARTCDCCIARAQARPSASTISSAASAGGCCVRAACGRGQQPRERRGGHRRALARAEHRAQDVHLQERPAALASRSRTSSRDRRAVGA